MGRHEHFTRSQPRPDVALKYFAMMLVRDEDHDDIGLLCCAGRRRDLQAISLRLGAALAVSRKADHYIAAVIAHVESVGVSLTSITYDGDTFVLHQFDVGVCIIIDV